MRFFVISCGDKIEKKHPCHTLHLKISDFTQLKKDHVRDCRSWLLLGTTPEESYIGYGLDGSKGGWGKSRSFINVCL